MSIHTPKTDFDMAVDNLLDVLSCRRSELAGGSMQGFKWDLTWDRSGMEFSVKIKPAPYLSRDR